MRGRPIWSSGVWGGFVCTLFAFSSFMHGEFAASAVMMAGAVVLIVWAVVLGHGKN
jgi:hypothetical protein